MLEFLNILENCLFRQTPFYTAREYIYTGGPEVAKWRIAMGKVLTGSKEISDTLALFQQQLNSGKSLKELPLRIIDWNSAEGVAFLRSRCYEKGTAEDIIKNFKYFTLTGKNSKVVLTAIVANSVHIGGLPVERIVKFAKGDEKEHQDLLDAIVEFGHTKEFLSMLRADKTYYDGPKKYDAYDYIVEKYGKQGFGNLPPSDVIFGKDFQDELKEENERKKYITKEKMAYLTKRLNDDGLDAVKLLWRGDIGLGILHYPNVDDVRGYPDFTAALTKVIGNSLTDFEELFQCTRAFPLLYGGGPMSHAVPDVIDKAFKKYHMLLTAFEKDFLEELGDRERQDYFFFAKLAVTNPKFNWDHIDFSKLPEEGAIVYNENDEQVILSLREQLEELVVAAVECGIPGSDIPAEYAQYHTEFTSTQIVIVNWRRKREEELRAKQQAEKEKASFFRRLFNLLFESE